MKLSNLSAKPLHDLKLKEVKFKECKKLLKYLWDFGSFPKKYQSLLTWITNTLQSSDISKKFVSSLWKLTAELLNEAKFNEVISKRLEDKLLQPAFIKSYIKEIENWEDMKRFEELLSVGKSLFCVQALSNSIKSRFDLFSKLSSAWLNLLIKLETDTKYSGISKSNVKEFVLDMIISYSNIYSKQNDEILALEVFLDNFFKSSIIYLKLESCADLDNVLMKIYKKGIFKKYQLNFYNNFVNFDLTGKKQTKKADNKINQCIIKLQNILFELFSKQNTIACIALFYKYYLSFYSQKSTSHFRMFSKLYEIIALNDDDATSDEKFRSISHMIKLNIDYNVYQSNSDSVHLEDQVIFYQQLLNKILSFSFSLGTASCIQQMSSIDPQKIIEPKLVDIFLKTSSLSSKLNDQEDIKQIHEMFSQIFKSFIFIRKVEIVVDCFIKSLKTSDEHSLTYIFSQSLVSSNLNNWPTTTVLDIWQKLQNEISKESDQPLKIGCKRHLPDHAEDTATKIIKTGSSSHSDKKTRRSFRRHVIILLSHLTSHISLDQMTQQMLATKRIFQLLEHLNEVVASYEKEEDEDWMGLLLMRDQFLLQLKRYDLCTDPLLDAIKMSWEQSEISSRIEQLATKQDSFIVTYRAIKWLCLRLSWLSWQHSETFHKESSSFNDAIEQTKLQLNQLQSRDDCAAQWNGDENAITSPEMLCAAIDDVTSNFATLIANCSGKTLFRFNKYVIDDQLLVSMSFRENANLQLEAIRKVFEMWKSCSSNDCLNDIIEKLFDIDELNMTSLMTYEVKIKKQLKKVAKQMTSSTHDQLFVALRRLPVEVLLPVPAGILLVLSCVIWMQGDSPAKGLDVIRDIIVSNTDPVGILKLIPLEIIFVKIAAKHVSSRLADDVTSVLVRTAVFRHRIDKLRRHIVSLSDDGMRMTSLRFFTSGLTSILARCSRFSDVINRQMAPVSYEWLKMRSGSLNQEDLKVKFEEEIILSCKKQLDAVVSLFNSESRDLLTELTSDLALDITDLRLLPSSDDKLMRLQSRVTSMTSLKSSSDLYLLYTYYDVIIFLRQQDHVVKLEATQWKKMIQDLLSRKTESLEEEKLLEKIIILILMLHPNEDHFLDLLSSALQCLDNGNPNLRPCFMIIRIIILSYNQLDKTFWILLSNENDIHEKIINFLRDFFDKVLRIATSEDLHQETLISCLRLVSQIISMGSKVIRHQQLWTTFSCFINANLSNACVFHHVYDVINAIFTNHSKAVMNVIPLILSHIRSMIRVIFHINSSSKKSDEDLMKMSHLVKRVCLFISSNFTSCFKRRCSYLIADYIYGLTQGPLHPSVKTNLETAMFHLMAVCDDHMFAMLNVQLPAGVRDIFQKFHSDFEKYFKYSGAV